MKKILLFAISISACIFSAYGTVLHIGNRTILLTETKTTSPSLYVSTGNKTMYAPMHPSQNCKFCAVYNGEKYNIGITILNYLYFDGESYIDLGFPPSADLQFEIKAHMDDSIPDHDGCLLGARNGSAYDTTGQYLVWYTNDLGYCGGAPHILPAFGNHVYTEIIVEDIPQTIRWHNNTFSVNDTVIENVLPISESPTQNNLSLGAVTLDTKIDSRKFLGRIYYARFWHDDELIMNLIPALDISATPGFYDTVSQRFFYNSGTGQFKYDIE